MDYSALSSKNPKEKYACSKEIIRLAKENPKLLVKDYDFFVKLLSNDNNILKWTALDAIGGIISITGSKEGVKLLISYLNKGKMITAGHATNALTQIALAKPEFKELITNELIKTPKYKYDSNECNMIACGHVIACLNLLKAKGKAIESFLKSQLKSKRNATKVRAERMLKNIYFKA